VCWLSRASGSASSWRIRLGVLQLRITLAANSRPCQAIRQTLRSASQPVVQAAVVLSLSLSLSSLSISGIASIFFAIGLENRLYHPYMTHSSTTECSSRLYGGERAKWTVKSQWCACDTRRSIADFEKRRAVLACRVCVVGCWRCWLVWDHTFVKLVIYISTREGSPNEEAPVVSAAMV